jgi:hypothetical protein
LAYDPSRRTLHFEQLHYETVGVSHFQEVNARRSEVFSMQPIVLLVRLIVVGYE